MLYHCGLLDERPEKSRTLEWVKRPVWGNLPADIERELRIFLAMPGLSYSYVAHVFRRGMAYVRPHVGVGYDVWRDEVIANWMSATREDCIKLTQLRPGKGNVPVIAQLRALQDLKAGLTLADISREYGVSEVTVAQWRDKGVRSSVPLPSGFALLSA